MRQILDLLSIILPAAIVAMGFVRLFVQRTRFINGFTMFFALLLLLIGLVRYFLLPQGGHSTGHGPTPEPLSVSKHSAAFNGSVKKLMEQYFGMTAGFVKADTGLVQSSGRSLAMAIDSLSLEEIKKDSLIYLSVLEPYNNMKTELASILADPSWEEKKGSLNIFSDNLRSFLTVVQYDAAKLYWQECPTAFGEDRPGNWISPGTETVNPYGGSGGSSCGGPKDTINFLPRESPGK